MIALAHVFFSSLSYIPYALLMYVCLVFAPALALFPRLTEKPLYFIATPIISLVIDVFIAAVLFKFQLYTHLLVLIITGFFVIVAGCRFRGFSQWQKSDGYLLAINFAVFVPLFVMCGLSAFLDQDALQSWNLWAQYYYHGNLHEAVFLSARGYPPFLPLLISYAYKFLGTPDYQGVVKTIMVMFPFTILNGIAFAGKIAQRSWQVFGSYVGVIAVSLFTLTGYRFPSLGYADPVLAASLVLAVFYTVLYREDKNEQNYFVLIFATLTTIAASLSKQPGFLWALFSFPLILIIRMIKTKKYHTAEVVAIIVACIPVLLWVLGPGRHFAQNTGVIQASTGKDNLHVQALFDALGYSVIKYWIKAPWIFILYGWALFSARKNITTLLVFISYILPGTILWFMLGSYDGRLGLQLLVTCALLIALNGFYPVNIWSKNIVNLKRIFQISVALGIISFVFFSINENTIKHGLIRGHLYPLNGPKTILDHYFVNDGDTVYQLIYEHPEKKLWVADQFVAAFFKYNNSVVGASAYPATDVQTVYGSILSAKPDYLISAEPAQFPIETAFNTIAKTCPFLLSEWNLTPKPFPWNYRIYTFNYSEKAVLQCQTEITHENH